MDTTFGDPTIAWERTGYVLTDLSKLSTVAKMIMKPRFKPYKGRRTTQVIEQPMSRDEIEGEIVIKKAVLKKRTAITKLMRNNIGKTGSRIKFTPADSGTQCHYQQVETKNGQYRCGHLQNIESSPVISLPINCP